MNEFIEQFLVESNELVAQATDDLLALEDQPHNRERLDSAFRAFHTLKGAAGIVDFAAMETALHAAEDVLSAVRAGADPITPSVIGDCLTCLDQVVQWLEAMQGTGEPPANAQAAAEIIVARFKLTAVPASEDRRAESLPLPSGAADLLDEAHALLRAQMALLDDLDANVSVGRTASAARVALNVLQRIGFAEGAADLARILDQSGGAPEARQVRTLIQRSLDAAPTGPARTALREASDPLARSLRVDVDRIDALVNLTGEFTVAKNALAHAVSLAHQGADIATLAALLKNQHAVLGRLVDNLQHSVLNIRVLPLRQVFQRFPRLVREMIVSLGKPAKFVTEGDATEADKTIVENLFEPLLHVIRNALDHGIENAEARAMAGKAPSATITLRAAREGDRILIEVEDDGAGVDLTRVREAAAGRGLVAPDALATMSEQDIVDLIFMPGFSTATEVTGLSGRGVGMDAVRNSVERLGGRVRIESRLGRGTIVRMVVPFTVMMSRVMTVEAGGQIFGVPIDGVVESVHVPRAEIISIGAARAFVRRDRTVPLFDLGLTLGGGVAAPSTNHAQVIIVSAAGHLGALEVDRLGEPMDIMLKPMAGLLAGAPGIAGTTLLGDGRVLIVLDLHQLLQ